MNSCIVVPVDTALYTFGSEIVQIECLHLIGPVSVSVDTMYNYNIILMLHIINISDCCCHSVNILKADAVKLVNYIV